MDKICRGSTVGEFHKQGYRIEGAAESSHATARGSHVSLNAYKLERGLRHSGSSPTMLRGSDTYCSRVQDRSPSPEHPTRQACLDSRYGTRILNQSSEKTSDRATPSSPSAVHASPRPQSPQESWFRHKYGTECSKLQYSDHRFWRNAGGYSPAPAPKQYPVAVRKDDDPQGQAMPRPQSPRSARPQSPLSKGIQSPRTATSLSEQPVWGPASPQGRSQRQPQVKAAKRTEQSEDTIASETTVQSITRRNPGPPRCAQLSSSAGNKRPALRLGVPTQRGMGSRSMSSVLSTASSLSSPRGVPSRKSLGR